MMITLTALLLSGLGLAVGGGVGVTGNPLRLPDCEGAKAGGVLPRLCSPCLLSRDPP